MKPNLVPDCDVHGSPMERHGALTRNRLEEAQTRDVEVWRCQTSSCDRYFYEDVGYQTLKGAVATDEPSPACERHGTKMVVQSCLS
jgi:hypothetical protein